MTSLSKYVSRCVPKENLQYLPKHAIKVGGIRGKKGMVRVKLEINWLKRTNNKLKVLFRGM